MLHVGAKCSVMCYVMAIYGLKFGTIGKRMNKPSPELSLAAKIIMEYSSGAVFPIEVPHRYRAKTFMAGVRRYLPKGTVKLALEGRILWVKIK